MPNAKKPGTGATNKRRKELAAAKYQRQTARREERAAQRRRRQRILWTAAGLVFVLAAAAIVLWPDSAPSDVAQPSATPSPSASDIGCDPLPTPAPSPSSYAKAPAPLSTATAHTLTLTTNCGDIEITTLPAKAPATVGAMLGLAEDGYFDGTSCHRLTTGGLYVLQCGDPTGTGTGGPGFTLPDENLPKAGGVNYPAGTVAMANAGKGTAGSQFFLVYQDTTLPPDYTIWGTVTSGLDVVEKVAAAGVAGGGGDGAPAAPIGIVSASVAPPLG